MEQYIAVAIDGPSGAGKSTLARAVAAEFGFLYVDTGALYRTVGLYIRRKEIDPDDAAAVAAALPGARVSLTASSAFSWGTRMSPRPSARRRRRGMPPRCPPSPRCGRSS